MTRSLGVCRALTILLACIPCPRLHAQGADGRPPAAGDEAATAVGADPAARSPRGQLTTAAVESAAAAYVHEPTIAQVTRSALRHAGNDPSQMRSIAQRARRAGWLPRLELSVRRGTAVDLSSATSDTGTLRTSTDDDLTLQGQLSFDLPRLVFARAEVSIAAEQRNRHNARNALVQQVISVYFERRRLQLQRDLSGVADLSLHARIMELTAVLNAFTNGAFQRIMGAP